MSQLAYAAKLTIPHGTTANAPASSSMDVPPGRLKLFRLIVPPGPRGEVEIWLGHQTHQLLPVPPGSYSNIDDDVIVEPLDYRIDSHENTLTLYGISPNANFDHTVSWSVVVETPEMTPIATQSPNLLDRLTGLFS